jgi:hypothetical protein
MQRIEAELGKIWDALVAIAPADSGYVTWDKLSGNSRTIWSVAFSVSLIDCGAEGMIQDIMTLEREQQWATTFGVGVIIAPDLMSTSTYDVLRRAVKLSSIITVGVI